jgi:2-amino-4-hydroxy-6-hydroxymethyldihydropteridine diphosphokinase
MCSEPEAPSAAGTTSSATRAFIGLGANVGDRRASIEAAILAMSAHPRIEVVRCTGLVETAPWGVADQPAFLNAVAEVRTTLDPRELLRSLKCMECELGRTPGPRWGPREIDLDILLYGDRVIDDPLLTIPHPELAARPFVLSQLIELDPGLVHPGLGRLLTSIAAGAGEPDRADGATGPGGVAASTSREPFLNPATKKN